MTDIFPAPDQSIGDVVAELKELELQADRDFRLHYSWDAQPYIQCTADAYQKWSSSRSKANREDATAPSTEDGDDDEPEDTQAQSGNRQRQATKRR